VLSEFNRGYRRQRIAAAQQGKRLMSYQPRLAMRVTRVFEDAAPRA
jgi:hypothetical protein